MVRTSDPLGRESVDGLLYRGHYIFNTENVSNITKKLIKEAKELELGFDVNTFISYDVVMGKNGYIYGNLFVFYSELESQLFELKNRNKINKYIPLTNFMLN